MSDKPMTLLALEKRLKELGARQLVIDIPVEGTYIAILSHADYVAASPPCVSMEESVSRVIDAIVQLQKRIAQTRN